MNEFFLVLRNYIRSAWRFRWYAVLVAWLVAIVGWAAVFILPDKYESSAKVYVDTDSVLRPLLEGLAVQTDINQRLHLMTRTLMSSTNLEEVLRETDLDYKAKTAEELEGLIAWLRKTIVINASGQNIRGTRQQENFYTISFVYRNPYVAQKVVKTLLNIFMEQVLGDTRVESETAQKFLKQQISRYEARLREAEDRLTEFKRNNVDTLPDQSGGVFANLQAARTELQNAELEMKEAQIRRDELRRQYQTTLAEEEERRQAGEVVAGSPMANQILAMEIQLDELRLRYTNQHPDVIELKSTIAELKTRQEDNRTVDIVPMVNQVSTALEELKLAYRQSEVELTAIQLRTREYQKRIENMKQMLDVLPKVESELARLNRDYDINRENYQQLVARLESARMSEQADEAGDNVKFRIVEPPTVPIQPIGPKRMLLSAGILLASLGVGGVFAFFLSQLKPVYLDASTLRQGTEFPVFGQISRIWTRELALKRKIEVSGFFTATFLLVPVFCAVLALYILGLRETVINHLKQIVAIFF